MWWGVDPHPPPIGAEFWKGLCAKENTGCTKREVRNWNAVEILQPEVRRLSCTAKWVNSPPTPNIRNLWLVFFGQHPNRSNPQLDAMKEFSIKRHRNGRNERFPNFPNFQHPPPPQWLNARPEIIVKGFWLIFGGFCVVLGWVQFPEGGGRAWVFF